MYESETRLIKYCIVWILGNLIRMGSRDQIAYIVEYGAIEILLDYNEKFCFSDREVFFGWLQNLLNLIDPEKDIIHKQCSFFKRKI